MAFKLDPTKTRLSPHFLLSDMMGCQSVYAKGLPNVFRKQPGHDVRLDNARALCENALEPILATIGSFSISYGFISPELSREIVTYQDPDKPSHHRFDLGAAVDICPHRHVLQSNSNLANEVSGAPIVFAFDYLKGMPLSRLITYSESPYLCIAVSAAEVERGEPRGAWYENRYTGKPKVKPQYIKYPSPDARRRGHLKICECGFEHKWTGAGYPTYHGGGTKQLHHIRTSEYTMVSDFLFDSEFVDQGIANRPLLTDPLVKQGFEIAGGAYDWMLKMTGFPRLSIVSAYTSPRSPNHISGRHWAGEEISFEIVPPEYCSPEDFISACFEADTQRLMLFAQISMEADGDRVIVTARRNVPWAQEVNSVEKSNTPKPPKRVTRRR